MTEPTWYEKPELLHQTVQQVESEHAARVLMDKCLLRLYYQRPVTTGRDPLRPYAELSTFETLQQLGFNLTREVVDGSAALTCVPLAAKVEPIGADFETMRAAELMGRVVDGVFDSCSFLDVATRAYRDGSTTTLGPIKWYVDEQTKEIKCENIDPLSVFWHYDEGPTPAHLYVTTPVPRARLKQRFPAKAGMIDALPTWRRPSIVGVEAPGVHGGDNVRVDEGWRIKLGDENGRHVITSGDVVLDAEEWGYDFFPVPSFRWADDFRSMGGVSLARIVAPYHIWSNQLVRQVFESAKGAVPRFLTHEDSLVDTVSDLPFEAVTWSGMHKPEVIVGDTISPQVIAQIAELRDRAHAEGGVNINAAAGTRPVGLNSAPAQRAWVDLVNVRMRLQQRAWERLWRESARIVIALAADAYKTKSVRVKAPGTDLLEEIKWSSVKIKEDQYRVRFDLVSGLSLSVSSRMEQLGLLKDSGAIDTADYLRRIDLPDVKNIADRVNAPRDLAEKQIASALNEGVFMMPSALQGDGLDALIRIGSQEYQRAMLSGRYPAANMEALRRLILAAKARQGAKPETATIPAEPAPPEQAAAEAAPPPMAPMTEQPMQPPAMA